MTTLAFKFGSLFLKQLSKPVAVRIRSFVLNHPVWRARTLSFARAVHRWEVYASTAAVPGKKAPIIGELQDDKAIELASTLISDTFVFTVATVLLVYEYNRGQEANRKKSEAQALERDRLRQEAEEERIKLVRENIEQYKMLTDLTERINALDEIVRNAKESEARRKWWARANKGSVASMSSDTIPDTPPGKDKLA